MTDKEIYEERLAIEQLRHALAERDKAFKAALVEKRCPLEAGDTATDQASGDVFEVTDVSPAFRYVGGKPQLFFYCYGNAVSDVDGKPLSKRYRRIEEPLEMRGC